MAKNKPTSNVPRRYPEEETRRTLSVKEALRNGKVVMEDVPPDQLLDVTQGV